MHARAEPDDDDARSETTPRTRKAHSHSHGRLQLLLDRIAQRLASDGGGARLAPRHMAHVVWGYAAFAEYPKQLIDPIAAAAAQRIGEFKPVRGRRAGKLTNGRTNDPTNRHCTSRPLRARRTGRTGTAVRGR